MLSDPLLAFESSLSASASMRTADLLRFGLDGSVALLCLPLRFAGIFKILASFAEFRTWLECLVSRKCCDKLHDKNYI